MNWLLFAQDPAQAPPSLSSLLVPMAIFLVVMYFLMIMPANRQRKQQQALLASMKKGDKVLTQAGIIGTVVTIRDDAANEPGEVTLRSDDTKIRVLKSTIVNILSRGDESDVKG